jgi:hypothetical protein
LSGQFAHRLRLYGDYNQAKVEFIHAKEKIYAIIA